MAMDHLLGIDAGTSSTKAVLVATDGTVAAEASLSHSVDLPAPGRAEQDPDGVWWKELAQLCRTLAERAPRAWRTLRSVGVSAIGATVVPVAADGRVVHPAILYGIDTRAEREIDLLNRRLGPRRILRVSGRSLSAQAVGPKILWLRRHCKAVFEQTAHFLSAPGFLTFRLTGVPIIDHYSAVSFAPLYDVARRTWHHDALTQVVPRERLPRLAWSADIAGRVTAEASVLTGLPPGTPVVVGTSDAAAEALSVGVTEPGDVMLMYGSTLFIVAVVRRWRPDRTFWPTIFCLPGVSTVTAGTATFGAAERWLVEEILAAPGEREGLIHDAMTYPPGSDGLVMLPYLSGERSPLHDPHASGAVVGLTLRHTRAHLYRAVLEGTAFSVRHNLELLEEKWGRARRLVAVGGGSDNVLWRRIVSDVLDRPQVMCRQRIGAAYGAAYLAGLGCGLVDGLNTLRERWAVELARETPDPTAHRAYEAPYQVYRRLYPQLKRDMHVVSRLQHRGEPPTPRP